MSSYQPYNFASPAFQQQPLDFSSTSRDKGKWREDAETEADAAAYDLAFEAHAKELQRHNDPVVMKGDALGEQTSPEVYVQHSRARNENGVAARCNHYLELWDREADRSKGNVFELTELQKMTGGLTEMITSLDDIPLEEIAGLLYRRSQLEAKIETILDAAGVVRTERQQPENVFTEPVEREPPVAFAPEKQGELPQPYFQADYDLAQTAKVLLSNVEDNQTTKFRESSFLSLMRQLRDGEVYVRGDKMVDIAVSSIPDVQR